MEILRQQDDDVRWGFLLNTIEKQKCILFLGPELFKNTHGLSITDQLFEFLKSEKEGDRDIPDYYKNDGLFSFKSRNDKGTYFYKFEKFYNQSFPKVQALLEKIAKIPFHFIVSITPDNKCFEVFEDNDYKAESLFYSKKENADNSVKKPTKDNPIIYNIFGSIEKPETMVISHHDLFDYLESIFKENSMPKNLKLAFKEADSFVFLGLDFEKWYMQLLLRVLYLHNENYTKYASNHTLSDDLKIFCKEQFKIEFIPSKINEFVDKLVEKCSEADLIRSPYVISKDELNNTLEVLLEHDAHIEAFTYIERKIEALNDDEQENFKENFLIAKRKYRRAINRFNSELITQKEYDIETNEVHTLLRKIYNETPEPEHT